MLDTKHADLSQSDIQQRCFDFMESHDLVPPSIIEFRTDFHKEEVPLKGKPSSNRDGRYAAYENPHSYTLLVWNWTDGTDHTKPHKLVIPKTGEPLTYEQQQEDRTFKEKRKKEADIKTTKKNELIAQRTKRLLESPRTESADPKHTYLNRKQVPPINIYQLVKMPPKDIYFHRKLEVGDLIVPMRDFTKKVWSFQFIKPEKDENGDDKWFPFGGKKTGLFFCIPGNGTNPMPHFCEGYATGVDINQATGANVYVCFDAGNIPAVVKEYLKAKPTTTGEVLTMVLCGDNDKWYWQWDEDGELTQGKTPPEGAETALVKRDPNPGKVAVLKAAEIAKKVPGVKVVVALPELKTKDPHMSDFNDLRQEQGIDVVRSQIDIATMMAGIDDSEGSGGTGMKTELKMDGDEFEWFYGLGGEDGAKAEVVEDEEEDVSPIPEFKEEFVHPLVYAACKDYAKAFDVGIEVPVFSLLTTVGACIEKKRCIQVKKKWTEFPNLYNPVFSKTRAQIPINQFGTGA